MTKPEVELIVFKVAANGEDAIYMKIYKDGTTCRYGAGGLPQLRIAGMSRFSDASFFDILIDSVPDDVLEKPIGYEEETPNGDLEYVIAFYGGSKNGQTGEGAEWTKSTGIRVKLDQQTQFDHPIMGLLDGLTMDAAELTNDWYFDIMIKAAYNALSSKLPEDTVITEPETEQEVYDDFENYINQMLTSARSWSLKEFEKDKTYSRDNETYEGVIQQEHDSFRIDFNPVG